MKKSIIFMGTPDFAVPSLQALSDAGYPISLVVTQPDRPAGRGQRLTSPPVKLLAEKLNLPVFQPESLKKSDEARARILATPCDFLVVVAFGQILPKVILEHPRIAPLNVHASLLPAYRGAAPIQRALMEGDETTGVTIQWMVEALDLGDILHQAAIKIHNEDTSETLHDRLKTVGAKALLETLEQFEQSKLTRTPQDPRVGSYAAKLSKEEAQISFQQPAFFVHRKIMGLNPWPVAEVKVLGKSLKIHRSRLSTRSSNQEPGTVVESNEELLVACEHSCIALEEVQLENKKRMSAQEFLRGHPVPEGLILGTKAT